MSKHFLISFASLFLIWLLLSGYFKTTLLVLGVLSCLLVTALCLALKVYHSHFERLLINLKLPLYLPWLFLEIIKSNLHVAWCIITGHIQPQTIKLKVNQKTPTGIAIHANSITLTPGTISVDIENDELLVHALTDTTAASAKTGEMDAQVCQLEGRE